MHNNFLVNYEIDKEFDSESFIKLRLRVCHDGLSPNKTFFTKEVIEDAKDTIKNKPILAHVKYDSNGMPMFGGHDMHTEEDRFNEGEVKVIYDETPIGVIPEDCNFAIEEYDGKNYAFADAFIWREYSNYGENLVEDAVNTKLSMEISIPDDHLQYNAKEKYWDITKFKFRAISLLNPSMGTGMKDALATTQNFSQDAEKLSVDEKLLFIMKSLEKCLYSNSENKEEGSQKVTKFEELLQKYSKLDTDITFEVEGLSDDELEAKFVELFAEKQAEEPEAPIEFATIEHSEGQAEEPTEGQTAEFTNDNTDVIDEPVKFIKTFEISHDDIRAGLYHLLSAFENSDDDYYYISDVYETHFIYEGWMTGKIYKQSYEVSEDNIALKDERIEMYKMLLTASEKAELEAMRGNYSTLLQYKADAEHAEKLAVLDSEKYSALAENTEFEALRNNIENYSIQEIEKECKVIFADHVLSAENYSLFSEKPSRLNIQDIQDTEKKPYGGYFDKYVNGKK